MEFIRRRLGLIFRTLITLLALIWLVRSNNWHEVWRNVQGMDVGWLMLGVSFLLPTIFIVSWRWRMLLAVHDVQMRFWRVLELTMIGQFFSTVGVGTTGGDVFKIFYVTRAVPQRKAAVGFTVIVDRVIGLVALLLFGGVLALTRLDLLLSAHGTREATLAFFFFVLGGIGVAILGTAGPSLLRNPRVRGLLQKLPMARQSSSLVAAYERSARAVQVNLIALLGSIPSHASVTAMAYCVMRAMHLEPDLLTFAAVLSIVNMLIALPIAISGIGVREKLFCIFFALIGMKQEVATAFSLTYFALTLLWCLAGAPFYFLYRHETHAPAPNLKEVDPLLSEL